MDELTKSGAADNASLKSLDPMLLHSSSQYDNFYQNIFSFNVGSQEDMKKFLEKKIWVTVIVMEIGRRMGVR